MKCSQHYPEPAPTGERPVVFFADAGVSIPSEAGPDPFAALDDLMSAVEALCPSWPPRATFGPMHYLRL